MSETSTLTIGALAHAAGVGVETIRFYERKGLVPKPPRTPAGYRQYPGDTVDRVKFIRRAQGLGFALREISELLDLRVDEVAACGPVEAQAREKLEQVAGKIEALRACSGEARRGADSATSGSVGHRVALPETDPPASEANGAQVDGGGPHPRSAPVYFCPLHNRSDTYGGRELRRTLRLIVL